MKLSGGRQLELVALLREGVFFAEDTDTISVEEYVGVPREVIECASEGNDIEYDAFLLIDAALLRLGGSKHDL